MTARRLSRRDEPARPTSVGTPAPFTQDQVDALVRGKLDEDAVAGILESHRPPDVSLKPARGRKRSPEGLEEEDVLELRRTGRPSPGLAARLEQAAARSRTQAAPEAPEKTARRRPRTRPPASPGG